MSVLVTGGAGFIGSHTVLELLAAGKEVVVVDNLNNSKLESIKRVESITGKKIKFYEVDLVEVEKVRDIFKAENFESVIHFAAHKAVGESVSKPLMYYQNNLTSTLNLCQLMLEHKVTDFVFSSSCTVYGDPAEVPLLETSRVSAVNPYGRTKLFSESILTDIQAAHPELNIALLRYFNPVGAHVSGDIGEDPHGIPNNLMPYITQVAVGKREKLSVFGGDYPTHDGTGVRDYIHVVDLATGHLKALDRLQENPGLVTYNLGTGTGYSVLDVVKAFEKASGKKVPYEIVDRRAGDAAEAYADPTKAKKEMGWEAKYGIDEMCADSWRWQSKNPNGFD
ncbi:MAG: UDP-glucose 4-epimerase GalE [Bacteroidota bacterium]